MKILFFCPRWGSASLPPEDFVAAVSEAGYDGIEMGFPEEDLVAEAIPALAREAGLELIAQHSATFDPDVRLHKDTFLRRLERAATCRPLFIASQSGRDLWGLEENLCILDAADRFSLETGVPVYHETHRGRCLNTPWRTCEILRERPDTRLVFDMSHWCVVCESLLGDQAGTISSILPSVAHIHARVGHSQGAQVPDPRATEWEAALAVHLDCWDRIVEDQRKRGADSLTITPEFGPPPYLPTLPHTGMPVASQWDINVYMMQLLRQRYLPEASQG